MSDWESYYNSNTGFGAGLSRIIRLMARDMAGQTHGGEKALAGMIPGYSWYRSGASEYSKAKDYYQNTGTDPKYPADVSNLRPPTQSQITGGMPLPRMARTMDQLYTADIVEDLSEMYRTKRDSYEMSGRTADKWRYAWDTYNARYRR